MCKAFIQKIFSASTMDYACEIYLQEEEKVKEEEGRGKRGNYLCFQEISNLPGKKTCNHNRNVIHVLPPCTEGKMGQILEGITWCY